MSQLIPRFDDTPFITLYPTDITLPSHPEEYWEAKTAEALATMKEMGIEHLLAKQMPKQPPRLRRRVS